MSHVNTECDINTLDQTVFESTYAHIRKYFRYMNRNFIADREVREFNGNALIINKLHTHKFSVNDKQMDIMIGVYFPDCKEGDVIRIVDKNNIGLSQIKITNPNKIYIPVSDIDFIFAGSLYSEFYLLINGEKYTPQITRAYQLYLMYLGRHDIYNTLLRSNFYMSSVKEWKLFHDRGLLLWAYEQEHWPPFRNNTNDISELKFVHNYSAKVIQRAWRRSEVTSRK